MRNKFRAAFQGLVLALKDKSIRLQFCLAIIALLIALILKFEPFEYLFFLIAIALVISSEILNTAIEKLCDKVEKKRDPLIAEIKDLSAVAVLINAIIALIMALIIFIKHIGW